MDRHCVFHMNRISPVHSLHLHLGFVMQVYHCDDTRKCGWSGDMRAATVNVCSALSRRRLLRGASRQLCQTAACQISPASCGKPVFLYFSLVFSVLTPVGFAFHYDYTSDLWMLRLVDWSEGPRRFKTSVLTGSPGWKTLGQYTKICSKTTKTVRKTNENKVSS